VTESATEFKEFETAGWTARAVTYDRVVGAVTSRVVDELLDLAGVERGSRVLDLACGPGHISAAAGSRGASPIGVDLAEGMLEIARRRHPAIQFKVADAEDLPFEDASFDAAIGGFVFNHLPDPERGAAEMARVLRPGGAASVAVWDVPERSRLVGLVADAIDELGFERRAGQPEGPDPYRFADEGALRELLAGAGLEEIGVGTRELVHRANDAVRLWEGVLGGSVRSTASVEAQPPEVQARIRAVFVRMVEAYREGSRLAIPVVVKLAWGRKP
jgi:SAM-dependent methyltransferase